MCKKVHQATFCVTLQDFMHANVCITAIINKAFDHNKMLEGGIFLITLIIKFKIQTRIIII